MKNVDEPTSEQVTGSSKSSDENQTTSKNTESLPRVTESNPAIEGYYKSQTRKNDALSWLMRLGLPLIGLAIGVAAYYFAELREPIIRLEEKVSGQEEKIEKIEVFMEEVKRYMYSNQPTLNTNPPTTTD